jgi:RNA polymerase sigma-70 factor (sigma-E family)
MDRLSSDFDDFVRDASPSLLRTAYLLTGDRGHAEDLLQTALLHTAQRWRSVRTDPHAYARRAVVNHAKNRWRARSRRPREAATEIGETSYEPADSDVLLQQMLLPAVLALPLRQRAVLILRYFQDLSVEQTADVLGCRPGTVKSQTHHALAKLRESLGDLTDIEENESAH